MNANAPMADFLAQLKSAAPTPGGGAAAGLAGALAAALAHMVGSLTVGKKKFAAVEPAFRDSMARLDAAIARFIELAGEDARAFDAFMEVWRLPKDDETRQRRLEEAAREACRPPLEIVRLAGSLLAEIRLAADSGNPHAVSDAGVAALFAGAAARAAAMNVRINLPNLGDAERVTLRHELDDVLAPLIEEADRLAAGVEARL